MAGLDLLSDDLGGLQLGGPIGGGMIGGAGIQGGVIGGIGGMDSMFGGQPGGSSLSGGALFSLDTGFYTPPKMVCIATDSGRTSVCVCLLSSYCVWVLCVFDAAMAGSCSGERAPDHGNLHTQERFHLCRDDVPELGTRSLAGLCHPVQQEQVRRGKQHQREMGRQ